MSKLKNRFRYSHLVLNERINTLKTGSACNYTAYENDRKSFQVEIANQIAREETNQLSISIGAVMHTQYNACGEVEECCMSVHIVHPNGLWTYYWIEVASSLLTII